MADDITPGEASVLRDGPQMNLHEARAVANAAGTGRGEAQQKAADRDVTESPVREHLSASSGGAGNLPFNQASPDQHDFSNSETALGGADSVQKTTYGVGHGTEPTGLEEHATVGVRKGEGDVVSRVTPGGGVSPVAWVAGLIAVLALAVYGFGLFRG